MVIEVEQLQQRKGRVSNAELPVPRNERERGRVFEDERPVPGRVPFAWVKRHTTDYHGKPDDAAQRQGRWQPYSEASLDFIARHVVGALRCVNENGAAIARWPGPVLDILRSAGNELRPRLSYGEHFHRVENNALPPEANAETAAGQELL